MPLPSRVFCVIPPLGTLSVLIPSRAGWLDRMFDRIEGRP